MILLALVAVLATVLAWRRLRAVRAFEDAEAHRPLERLRGFHIFGPEDDEDRPPLHIPVLVRPSAAAEGGDGKLRVPVIRATPPVAGARLSAPNGKLPAPAPKVQAADTTMAASATAREAATRAAGATATVPPDTRPAATRAVATPASVARAATIRTTSAGPAPAVPVATLNTAPAAPSSPQAPRPAATRAVATPAGAAPSAPTRTAATSPTPRQPTAAPAAPPAKPQPRPTPAAPARPAPEIALQGRRNTAPAAAQPDITSGHILLVEDDDTIATMYLMLLGTKGYTTRHARDGVEGIEMVRAERPQLILLDMLMPRMDGIEFLNQLRRLPKTSDIPVVVLSNVADRALVDRALALGCVEYLVKAQTRPQVLLGALPHWLRGNRALTASV